MYVNIQKIINHSYAMVDSDMLNIVNTVFVIILYVEIKGKGGYRNPFPIKMSLVWDGSSVSIRF